MSPSCFLLWLLFHVLYTRLHIAKQVSIKMSVYEDNHIRAHSPSVCALYAHFFLSIFAIMEAAVRLMAHLSILLVLGAMYYFVYCLSCGKSTISQHQCLAHHIRMYGLYSALLCGSIWNLGNFCLDKLLSFNTSYSLLLYYFSFSVVSSNVCFLPCGV